MIDPVSYSSFVPLAYFFIVLVLTDMFLINQLKTEVPMEKSKQVTKKPKSNSLLSIVISILKTLWAVGTSAVAAGVLFLTLYLNFIHNCVSINFRNQICYIIS